MAHFKNRTNQFLWLALIIAIAVAGFSALATSKPVVSKPLAASEDRGSVIDPTERVAADEIVYVTKNGKKYHRPQCHFAHGAMAIPLSKAIENYTPCSICQPPVLNDKLKQLPVKPELKAEAPPAIKPELKVEVQPERQAPLPEVRVQDRKELPPVNVQEPEKPKVVEVHKEPVPAKPAVKAAPTNCPSNYCPQDNNWQPVRTRRFFR